MKPRYASVILDVDSTISAIEGIAWLAHRSAPEVQQRIHETTMAAMDGTIPLEAVYGERLQLVQPTRSDVDALGDAYVHGILDGVTPVVHALHQAGVKVVIVSGGVRQAILPLGQALGIAPEDVHAVSLFFHDDGRYAGYDVESPLARRGGKPAIVQQLKLPSPVIAVGDGITDAELKPVVDTFVVFVGITRHEVVVRAADHVIASFDELLPLILS